MSDTKRKIYEEQIDPLLQQAINICEENDIPVFASCQINEDRNGTQEKCTFFTSALLPKNAAITLHFCKEIMIGDIDVEVLQMLEAIMKKQKNSLDEFMPVPKVNKLN